MEPIWKLFHQKNFGQAFERVRAYTGDDCQSSEAYYLKGLIYWAIEELDLAEGYLQIGLQLDPNNLKCMLDLGRLLVYCDRFVQARSVLEMAMKKNQRNYQIYFCMARILESENELDQALQHYDQSLLLAPANRQCKKLRSRLQKKISKLKQNEPQIIPELAIQITESELLEQDCDKQQIQKICEPESICVACLQNQATFAGVGCGHCCLCQVCVKKIKKRCPLCTKVSKFIKIYKA